MYRVMIVDDESVIRQGLQQVVPFESLGFCVVGDASNGVEAVHKSEELQPDLIITDIRMPLMDGLTMCRTIQKTLPTVRFLILSGFGDFEYTQQAIDLNVLGYYLKPISAHEFAHVLEETRRKLDHEFEQRQNTTRLRRLFDQNLPNLQEKLLVSMLQGGESGEQLLEKGQHLSLNLRAQQYVLALSRISDAASAMHTSGIEDEQLMAFAVQNIAQETLPPAPAAHLFHFNSMLATLFLFDQCDEENLNLVAGWMDTVSKTVRHYLGATLFTGISSPCHSPDHLANCAREAISALEESVFANAEPVVLITDVEPGVCREGTPTEGLLRTLSSALKTCNRVQAHQALNQLMNQFQSLAFHPLHSRTFLLEVLLVFLQAARDFNLQSDLLNIHPGKDSALYLRLMEFPSPVQARKVLFALCDDVLNAINQRRTSNTRRLVDQALHYLHDHFCEADISLEHVARVIHISPSYFSSIFKKETQKTFHQSLNHLRMEKAMQLLTTTDWKTARIGEAVGISDPSYFSYAFKRHYGFSPSSARARKDESV